VVPIWKVEQGWYPGLFAKQIVPKGMEFDSPAFRSGPIVYVVKPLTLNQQNQVRTLVGLRYQPSWVISSPFEPVGLVLCGSSVSGKARQSSKLKGRVRVSVTARKWY
jgi:hypothetical protein